MTYKLVLKPSAEKQFAALPRSVQKRVFSVLQKLSGDPRPAGSIKLKGNFDYYRVRVGRYRVIYAIQDDYLKILVLVIAHRRDAYNQI